MSEMTYCQSCGMPLTKGVYGTEHDGSESSEYCLYCYKHGAFVDDCTMEEMIEGSLQHMKEANMLKEQGKTEAEALDFMNSFFPELKRWKKSS
ncbi:MULTISPECIES: zinc ribbon domain-containing protein [Enterococcus]|uniref:zinc ribbon domain-containing protein n=1 Tax=Enterococcus TaxID=1350 RepID=UPI00289035AD|nr:zinc ribbon domain-containing protein [Enterococcus avium]MDT2491844.1 zinc ribbon domain-containing protein [Enterococcus avium]